MTTDRKVSEIRTEHLRQPGHSKLCSREEMMSRIARFSQREADLGAFPDLQKQEGKRSVSYQISPDGTGGPAPIQQAHGFHLSISTLSKGIRPTVHSHPYNEVFMPLNARFRLFWGDDLIDHIDLDPFDLVSVPAGVFRTFENLDDQDGYMVAIFDHGGDPHTGIVVPPDVFDRFYRGWNPGMVGVQS